MPAVNETKLVTDMLWKAYEVVCNGNDIIQKNDGWYVNIFFSQYTDDLVPLMEFTTEQFGQASREVFSGSVSQTEEIIEKHMKVMDKIDKKKKEIINIISRGEKLAEMAKAPVFLGEKLAAMKKLWSDTNNVAKQRLDDLKVNA